MGGGIENEFQRDLQRSEAFLAEEKEKCRSNNSSAFTGSCTLMEGDLTFEAKPSSSLGADNWVSSPLVSADGSEYNVITTSIAGQDTMEEFRNVCKPERAIDKDVPFLLESAGVVEEIHRCLDLDEIRGSPSRREETKFNYELEGAVASELRQRKNLGLVSAGSADNVTTLCQRIESQNKMLRARSNAIEAKREKIRRYRPGVGLLEVGGVSKMCFAIPKMTTLLLVGPSGAGKSTLINNLIRVLDNSTCGFDRAQVYEENGDGSMFLQEYLVCKDTKHFLFFDNRGFSENNVMEDLAVVKKWMTDGICHGEAVCRSSDSEVVKEALEGRGRQKHSQFSAKRRVDFIIFVVNAVTVHKLKESHNMLAIENLRMLYKSPFLSFKDDKPAIVMTHGDKLPPRDRISTRIFVGELFGVSPVDQVFDISCFTGRSLNPSDADPTCDLALLDMLEFALERADRNLPYKKSPAVRLWRAYEIMRDHWTKLDHGMKTRLIFIVLLWLLCLSVLLITLQLKAHFSIKKRAPWHLGRF